MSLELTLGHAPRGPAGAYAHRPNSRSRGLSRSWHTVWTTLTLLGFTAGAPLAATLEVRPLVSADDAEEALSGSMYLNSGDLEFFTDGSTQQIVGIRWPAVTIPQGATITSAWVQFTADEAQPDPTTVTIRAQAADNALVFGSTTRNISLRALGTASATWSPVAWATAGQAGADQRTPELADLIREVVSRPGWVSGNAIVLVFSGTGHRTAYSQDGGATKSALLHVEYSGGSGPPLDLPPVASLSVTQAASPPLTVNASGAGSTDTDLTPIASYRFDFGDGTPAVTITAPASSTTHTYAAAGTYTVTLLVTDTGGLTSLPASSNFTVSAADLPPVASLSVTQAASPPLTVNASGAGSTDTDATPIASYQFNFGDGTAPVVTTAPTSSTTHTYAAAGTYSVTLLVTDTGGLTSLPASASITVSGGGSGTVSTFERRTLASNDDAEETVSSGAVNLSSGDLELIKDSNDQVVGMRFPNLAIPRGALITTAWVQFTARDAQSTATQLKFQGQAADNAAAFTTTAQNVSLRPRTTAEANWTPVAWLAGAAGPEQRTPELKGLVQQVVDRSGWASGNALAMIVTGTGRRNAWSRDGQSASSPLLHVEFTGGGGGGPPPNVPPVARLTVAQVASPPLTVSASGATSTDTDAYPIASYRFTFGDGTAAVVTTAPTTVATHTYAAAGTYTVTLTATDTGGLTSAPVTSSITVTATPVSPLSVYAGYYGTHHPDNPQPKPNPWMGSSGVVFVGTPDTPSGGWDTSAIRIDNNSSSSVTLTATVNIGSKSFALWGSRTVPAGQKLILAQTGYENFDGSDTNPAGCYGCDPSLCLTKVQSTVPVVHITINGVTTNYFDTGQVLNTGGVDAAGCPPTSGRLDESQNWLPIYPTSGSAPVAISESSTLPGTTRAGAMWMARPYPNPVRDDLTLQFEITQRGLVQLELYDVAGRLVSTPLHHDLEPGEYLKVVPVRGMMAGRYFARLRTQEGELHQSFVVVTR